MTSSKIFRLQDFPDPSNATFSFLQGNAPRVASRAQKRKIQAWLTDKKRTALIELFSSPRVAVEGKSRGLHHSGSFGIAHGWDLTKDSSPTSLILSF